jgi:hypothetical protein
VPTPAPTPATVAAFANSLSDSVMMVFFNCTLSCEARTTGPEPVTAGRVKPAADRLARWNGIPRLKPLLLSYVSEKLRLGEHLNEVMS